MNYKFGVISIIVILVVFIVIFLLLREFWCWYWKISELADEATYTNDLLEKILKELKYQNSKSENQNPSDPPDEEMKRYQERLEANIMDYTGIKEEDKKT